MDTLQTTEHSAAPAAWRGFAGQEWQNRIDVSAFIKANVTPYEGDEAFLATATPRTESIHQRISELTKIERERGILDADAKTPSTITSHAPGYIDKDAELIVGLQTDAPLKRAIMPKGGLRMVENGLAAYGYEIDPVVKDIFTKHRKTHNAGVFDAYTPEILAARKAGIITGLPDAYGRGRIIGDFRRVALYGVDALIEDKGREKALLNGFRSSEDVIRDREELSEQIRALRDLKTMAASYGFDVSRPAGTAQEAIQWLYLAYLAGAKEGNGAAMSFGRTSSFIDIYVQRDRLDGTLTESQAQELVDDLVMKLRIIRFLRTPDYDALFSGDPTWVTESIGGVTQEGVPLVTRTSFRFLQTLYNLGPAPEPNLTVLWSPSLPEGFKRFCAQVSIDTSAIQFENDDLLRPMNGDDAAIACCVSGAAVGKAMQFFGARANLAKALLYAINGGRDEVSGAQVAPGAQPVTGDTLDYDDVMKRYDEMLDWLADTYVDALNIIHFMHDKYAYEAVQMALHDYPVHRMLACGIAGLSVAADSLSAIRYASVTPVRDETGLVVDYTVEGEYPCYGNGDDRADAIASELVHRFMEKLRTHSTYRNAEITQSVLTITSNVVYGKKTGNTPDGRRAGEPFAPGANPMNGRDKHGLLTSALSVAKIDYADARDGISLTSTTVPQALGRTPEDRISSLVGVLDAYMTSGGYHMNVNVLERATLVDAMEHPENYPNLTIRVSGYAVNFVRLTQEQQMDVINRTFHGDPLVK
ncbi:formate C-acetyltransferase [Kineosporia sp. NBRC 101731]|uniref:formate C-acetyltransferase n=1 Tax=Kineosporia sp. NBRC 101731 TaxID=3032199 RepID=UPI0024A444BA|nr:formate C-acetyltransferase [Kineosporia sp. NBRC 101731]GLY32721.1 formate acetyltransferase [Kineosporia sp. NBRC 101731]